MTKNIQINVDPYNNISRIFKLITDDVFDKQTVLITSGSNGISIFTKSSNNNHVSLTPQDVEMLIIELQKVIPFSKEAREDAAAYWTAKNAQYAAANEIREKWTKKND